MPLRPPLTFDELRAIRERSDSPDVRALLWEIRRLQVIVLRADQLARSMPNVPGTAEGMIANALRAELVGEPCVEAAAAGRAEMLYPGRVK